MAYIQNAVLYHANVGRQEQLKFVSVLIVSHLQNDTDCSAQKLNFDFTRMKT
jgi:hypothetical protein